MNEDRYVAAIEISSSKIIGVVGKLRPTNQLDIIACEQDHGVEGVRYGVIQNLEDTSLRIQHLLNKLQRRATVQPRQITGVYIGLSGRSLRSLTTEVSKNLPDDTEITQDIIAGLRAQALKTAIDNSLEVVDAIPRIFKVGKTETRAPKGMIGNSIKATYDLIVCRPELKRNLVRTLHDKLGIQINGAMVTALCTGQLILRSDEKNLGCMLVDMGAETTTVTIYKGGHLRYFATLPLGGRNITRDITSLHILEDKAEDLKKTSGDAIARDSVSSLNMNGVKMTDVSNLIVARAEEIVANIIEQIAYADLKEKDIPGGIICIGGGSQLRGILELLGDRSKLSVRRGQLPSYIRLEDNSKAPALEIIEVASVLYTGATNNNAECLVIPQREALPVNGDPHAEEIVEEEESRRKRGSDKKPKKKGPSIFDKWSNKLSSFFTGNEDDDDDIIE
ncbi:MAG: cell division protein FtsA [Bacteroidales bacterium]|nr:cell division protein FtsA [Bacteroidales bacterium]MBD5289019.1 cell division protein FtsA [Bacteroides sp.]